MSKCRKCSWYGRETDWRRRERRVRLMLCALPKPCHSQPSRSPVTR